MCNSLWTLNIKRTGLVLLEGKLPKVGRIARGRGQHKRERAARAERVERAERAEGVVLVVGSEPP